MSGAFCFYPELRELNQTLLQANDRQFKQILEKMRLLKRELQKELVSSTSWNLSSNN